MMGVRYQNDNRAKFLMSVSPGIKLGIWVLFNESEHVCVLTFVVVTCVVTRLFRFFLTELAQYSTT
jgi:antibiotic biosynthesis monooxygenase (ABM) superfamily enzyme